MGERKKHKGAMKKQTGYKQKSKLVNKRRTNIKEFGEGKTECKRDLSKEEKEPYKQ
jgi:hypothetical protein